MATVGRSPPDGTESVGSPAVARLQMLELEGPEISRSGCSRDGDEKDDINESHRESVYDDPRETPNSPDELRPSEVVRVGSEIDSFVNRNRQASVAHLKLRPQASFAHLPADHQPEFYDVVAHAVTRKNSLLGIHTELKGQVVTTDDWVEPFISGDPNTPNPTINVVRLSMSVAQAKAKLDGTAPKAKHHQEQDATGATAAHEPGTESTKPLSPRAKTGEDAKAANATGSSSQEEADSVALNKQRQANTMPQRKELMTTKSPQTQKEATVEDDDGTRKVRITDPARFGPSELAVPPPSSKTPSKSILKPCPIEYNGLATLLRQEAYIASIMDRVKIPAKFMKYNLQGKPASRYFYITEDGTELHWTKTNPAKGRNKQSLTAEKPRKRFFADVRGVYYGPYNNRRVFRRFLENKDQFDGSGKDWLCITVAFDDRTLDFCCTTDDQVSSWFLCMQALAPLAASYLTCGSVLWRRLIMKLNAYGLNPDRWPGPLKDPTAAKGGRKK